MTFEEKLEVAELLDEMGVDIIEAGFPIASQGDFESVQEIARRSKNSVICGLARAQAKDIDVCADAIKPARQGRIHTFIGTSPLHRKYQMSIDEAEVLSRVTASVTRARSYTAWWNGRRWTQPAPRSISCAPASRPRSRPAPPPSTFPIRSVTPRRTSLPR